jgi:hypothetical protein
VKLFEWWHPLVHCLHHFAARPTWLQLGLQFSELLSEAHWEEKKELEKVHKMVSTSLEDGSDHQ